jgi:hypothetical protein
MINMSDPGNENVTLHFKNTINIYFVSFNIQDYEHICKTYY